ncbi:MAG: xanthine dehydrogenase family protein subunit M [Bryobacteraceae bacterium]
MQAFEYASPATLKEALGLLGTKWGEVDVLAGGTDQISLMKEYIHTPKLVVSVKGLKELHGISKSAAGLKVGAAVTVDELMSNATVRAEYPALYQAALGISSPQIRNMGTVGGDLCQRPRCWYFRNGHGLLAIENGQSMVVSGDNRYHSIFGSGPAYFVSASSFGPALIALGAKVKLASAAGSREVSADKFFIAPQNQESREIALLPNEMVTEIVIPSAAGVKSATYEVRQKDALDWPLAAASVALKMKGATVEKASIVLGHVGPTPVMAEAAAAMLAGKSISESVAEEAGKAAVADAKPLSDNAYKVTLARVAVKRALLAAAGKA